MHRVTARTWAKHNHCRFGWPDAKREAPLPTPSCNSVQSDLQIKLALRRQLKIIGAQLTWNTKGRRRELHTRGNLSHRRDEAVHEEVEEQWREDSAWSHARVVRGLRVKSHNEHQHQKAAAVSPSTHDVSNDFRDVDENDKRLRGRTNGQSGNQGTDKHRHPNGNHLGTRPVEGRCGVQWRECTKCSSTLKKHDAREMGRKLLGLFMTGTMNDAPFPHSRNNTL